MSYYVCKRIKNLPTPYVPSFKGTCKECGEEVWYSKYVYENDSLMREIVNQGSLLCVQCAVRIHTFAD